MVEFDRRSFLGASFGMAAGAAMPEWLARAFAIQESVSTWRTQQLRSAIERARKTEKPLLVLVVPDQNDRDVRGKWFGALLTAWHDETSWLLASCEIACATTAELGQALGQKIDGHPLFVLVDVGVAGARVTAIECQLPAIPEDRRDIEAVAQTGRRWMNVALLAGSERHGLSLSTLAAAAVQRLDPGQRKAIDAWLAERLGVVPDRTTMAMGTAEIWRRIGRLPVRSEEHVEMLQKAVFWQHCEQPIAGARWMSWGCVGGTVFLHSTRSEREAEEKEWDALAQAEKDVKAGKLTQAEFRERFGKFSIACGMGHVDEVSAQFLELWTAGD